MDRDEFGRLKHLAAARGLVVDGPPEGRRLRRGDLELAYLDWGGAGPTAVFLHGGSLSAHTWDLVCAALAARMRCVALDLRGHGDSGWSDDYRIEASVEDVTALVEDLGVPRVHLVGMSLGGCVAGHATAALGERVASLTFVDVGAQVNFEASAGMREFMGRIDVVPRIEDLVARALRASPRTDPELMAYRYHSLMTATEGGFRLKQDRRRPNDFPHILGKLADLADLAPRVTCPVLVVRGARSRILTDQTAADFAARFPAGGWTLVAGAGHNVQEDNPVDLAAALAAHILG